MLGNLTNYLGGWQMKVAAVVLALAALFGYHTYKVKVAVNEAVTAIEVKNTKETLRLVESAQKESFILSEKAKQSQKEKDDKITALSSRVSTLTASLQHRPSRIEGNLPGNSPGTEGTKGVTGSSLYREDGEFLVREATQAVKLQEYLKMCYRDFDSAVEALTEFKRKNPR